MVLTEEEKKEAGERRRRAHEKLKQELAKEGWHCGRIEEIEKKYDIGSIGFCWWRMSEVTEFCSYCHIDREKIRIEYVNSVDRDPSNKMPSKIHICKKCGIYSRS